MTGIDLLGERAEFIRQGDLHMQQSVTYFARHCLDRAEIEAHVGLLSIVRAKFEDRFFDFASFDDSEAEEAVCIEALDDDDETTLDLVAWPIGRPLDFASMFGRADMLGAWNIGVAASYFDGAPLRLWPTPFEWIANGCRGCCVLQAGSAARRLIESAGPLACAERTARELCRAFEGMDFRRRLFVPQQMGAAA